MDGAEVHLRGTPGMVEHQHVRHRKGREGVLTQIQRDAQQLSVSSSARTATTVRVASAEREVGVCTGWGRSTPVWDAWGGRASACERQGNGRGYLHRYSGMLSG